jgi:hypothetical protein
MPVVMGKANLVVGVCSLPKLLTPVEASSHQSYELRPRDGIAVPPVLRLAGGEGKQ